MSDSPNVARLPSGTRPAGILATLMLTIGLAGAWGAWNELQTDSSEVQLQIDGSQAVAAATEAMAQALIGLVDTPIGRGLAIANILVSVLLIFASGAITFRRPSARWWIGQALVANVIWTIANFAGRLFLMASQRAALLPILQRYFEAQAAEQSEPVPEMSGDMILGMWGTTWFVGMGVMLVVYLGLFLLHSRKDVKAFLGVPKAER